MIWRNLLRSFQKNLALQFSTWLVLSLCCLLMAGSLLLSANLQNLLTMWGDSLQVTVYLKEGVSAEQIQLAQNEFQKDPRVRKVEFKSKEEALLDFQKQISDYAPEMSSQADILSVIPASMIISLSEKILKMDSLKGLKEFVIEAQSNSIVEDVSYGQEWVKNYSQFAQAIQSMSWSVFGVLTLAFVFVMGNVIRQSIFSRKEEIEVYELLGAHYYKIRMPFIIEGFVLAALSASTGLMISWAAYEWFFEYIQNQMGFLGLSQTLQFLNLSQALLFVFSVALIGAFGSFLCIGRMNTGWLGRKRLEA